MNGSPSQLSRAAPLGKRDDGEESAPLHTSGNTLNEKRDRFTDALSRFERDMLDLVGKVTGACGISPVTEERPPVNPQSNSLPPRVPPRGAFSAQGRLPLQTPGPTREHRPTRSEAKEMCGLSSSSSLDTTCVRDIALSVWAVLGFFALPPPLELEETAEPCRRSSSRRLPEVVGRRDDNKKQHEDTENEEESVRMFLTILEGFYRRELQSRAAAPRRGPHEEEGEEKSADNDEDILRNGLWLVLFNAVFYCVTALDRGRTFLLSDLECFVGAAWDLDDAACGSSEDEAEMTAKTKRRAPTRLQWSCTNRRESASPQSTRRPSVPHTAPLSRPDTVTTTETAVSARRGQFIERLHRRALLFGGRLCTPPPIRLWYFVVRTLAQIGYRRDAFYISTPQRGCVHELMLAMLWLTKEYQLIAVAEYVHTRREFPFLFGPREDKDKGGEDNEEEEEDEEEEEEEKEGLLPIGTYEGISTGAMESAAAYGVSRAGAALLRGFPDPVPWPPVSFVAADHVARRLSQIRRILPDSNDNTDNNNDNNSNNNSNRSDKCRASRALLSAQRLIALSMSRLQCALHQRAEQTAALGLHTARDAQLCLREHDAAYRRLTAGLRHVRGVGARARDTAKQLGRLGTLVAGAIRRAKALSRSEGQEKETKKEREDDDAWRRGRAGLYADDFLEERLQDVLVRFRATRAREQLADLWDSLRRAASVGRGAVGSPEEMTAVTRRVRRNMNGRYALDASLRAELDEWREAARIENQTKQKPSEKQKQKLKGKKNKNEDDDDEEEVLHGEYEGYAMRARDTRATGATGAIGAIGAIGATGATGAIGKGSGKGAEATRVRRGPLVTFALVTRAAVRGKAQETAVGRPTSDATTSARLETERLMDERRALRSHAEYRAKYAAEYDAREEAVKYLREYHQMRIVPRKA